MKTFSCDQDNLEYRPISITKTKARSERAELIQYFVDRLRNKDNKPFSARLIAIKLSHLSLEDLYYLKSTFQDTYNRKGIESAQKYFWWSIK